MEDSTDIAWLARTLQDHNIRLAETDTLDLPDDLATLADLNGQWIDHFHDRNGLKYIVLDMVGAVSPAHGRQEGSVGNGHADGTSHHPDFLLNQFGMLESCALRHGDVHSADIWRNILDPVIARYAERDIMRFFRADESYALPAIYERLEEANYFYAIRLPEDKILREKIAHRLTRPMGRPSQTKVKQFFEDFEYQAASWDKPRRVIAKTEWHPSELFPRVGFIVTNLPMEPDWMVRFYNQRSTAEQYIQKEKYGLHRQQQSSPKVSDDEVQLQLHALDYNLATFLRCIDLPDEPDLKIQKSNNLPLNLCKTERNYKIYNNDNLKVIKELPDNSIDSIITDPPYGIRFLGKRWDYEVPPIELWNECLRVLKPGGHLLAFAGTKTQHRMAVNIEDAGFEIRDMIAWVYGSGFPKSHNIGKTLNTTFGVDFEDHRPTAFESLVQKNQFINADFEKRNWKKQVGASHPEAQKWEGWGTSLKPALEPITLARKPIKGSIAKNALEWGTGGLNIDGCRVSLNGHTGRFPANFIHDGSQEVVGLLPEISQSFFYIPKCSKKDRNEGLEEFAEKQNNHPTVKPTDLMRYLVRMVTPENGVVLDPFMGSGSTGKATMFENKNFIGIELDSDYCEIAEARIEFALASQYDVLERIY